jgi:hypothetical protein
MDTRIRLNLSLTDEVDDATESVSPSGYSAESETREKSVTVRTRRNTGEPAAQPAEPNPAALPRSPSFFNSHYLALAMTFNRSTDLKKPSYSPTTMPHQYGTFTASSNSNRANLTTPIDATTIDSTKRRKPGT